MNKKQPAKSAAKKPVLTLKVEHLKQTTGGVTSGDDTTGYDYKHLATVKY